MLTNWFMLSIITKYRKDGKDRSGTAEERGRTPGHLGAKGRRASAGLEQHRPCPQVFSIAVFGPIINEGYVNADSGPELRCVFNGNAGACRFGIVLGLGAFLACAAFLLLDVRFQQISSVRDRRRAVLLDLGFSGRPGQEGRGKEEGWARRGAAWPPCARGLQGRRTQLLPWRDQR